MSTDDTTATAAQGEARTPGSYLQAAREAANLTPQSVATELGMTAEKVQALEQDQYERMVSETFVRGYMRRYARLVNLNGDEVVACYDRYLEQMRMTTEQVTQADGAKARDSRALPSWAVPAAIATGLILVWVVAVNLFGGDAEPAVVVAPQVESTVPPESPQPVEERTTGMEGQTTGMEEQSTAAPEAFQGESSQPDAPVDVAEVASEPPAVVTAPAADRIDLVFSAECWTEVTDADGKVLIADLQRAGQTLSLSGAAPFEVMLGNARAVAVRLNGEAVAVNPLGGRKTLRFTVGD